MKTDRNLIKYFIFFLISLTLTIFFVGIENFWFNKTNWLYGSGDLTNAQLSWQFFQNDIWRFPLGKNPNYGLEIANSIIFTDNIPLFAILFKILKPIIYENFQYISLWIFLCFFFQIFISFKLIEKITKDYYFSLIVSLLFLITPFLLFRLQHHFSLGAHWIILYAFYITYFIEEEKKKYHWYFVIFISLMTHLYFTVMVFIIYFFLFLENIFKTKLIRKEILLLINKILFSLLIMFIIGYFESSPINAVSSGYGSFKIDILSFFDPQPDGHKTWSFFLKDLNGTHLEGFTYLGIGNILLLVIALLFFIRNKFKKNNLNLDFKILRPLNFCFLIFIIWSLSSNISILGYELLNIDLPKYLFALLSIFSATGRFAWPVIYFLLFIASYYIYKSSSKKISYFLILVTVVVQISDVSFRIINNDINQTKIFEKDNNDTIWKVIDEDFEIIRTTYLFNNYGPLFSNFSGIMHNLKNIKTDIILNAAMDRKKAAKVRYDLTSKVIKSNLEKNTAYIVDNIGHLKHLKKQFETRDYGFFYRDDFWIVLPGKKKLMNENDLKELEKIKSTEIKLNEKYNVKFKDDFLGFGWTHNFGKSGAWTEGENSFLIIANDSLKKYSTLHLNFTPYDSNLNKDFSLEILANDKLIKKVNFENNKKPQNMIVELEKILLNEELIIHFRFSGLISPYDIFESPDARKLGILLNSFELRENK